MMNYIKIFKRNFKDNVNVFTKKLLWNDFIVEKKITFLDAKATVKFLYKNQNVSFGRIGDGEIYLFLGYDLNFQKYCKFFVEKMEEIFSNENNNFLLGIPSAIFKKEKYLPYPSYWRTSKIFLEKKLKEGGLYGDSLVSHIYPNFEILWKNKKVLLVAKKNFINTSYFIKVLESNALFQFEYIKNKILDLYDKFSCEIVLLSCGPCATIMSYELSKLGIISYDIGHFYEKFKK